MKNTVVASLGVAAIVGAALLVGTAAGTPPAERSPSIVVQSDQAPPTSNRVVVPAQAASEGRTPMDAPLERVLSALPLPSGLGAPEVASAFVLALTNFDAGESPQAIASRAAIYATTAFAIELRQRDGNGSAPALNASSRTTLALCRPLTADATTALFEVTVNRSSDAAGAIDHTTYTVTVTASASQGWQVVGATPAR